MKILKWIFDSYFRPIFIWLSSLTIIFLNKNYSEFVPIISKFLLENWLIISGLFVVTLLITFIMQRYLILKKVNKQKTMPFLPFITRVSDVLLTDEYESFKVYWAIWKKNEKVYVEFKPLCPKCKTALNEKITFWNKIRLNCVNCNFSIQQKNTYLNLREDVQAIAEGVIRRIESEE